MPFTFSHPAAVISLYRRFPKYLSLASLVVGSTIPDIAYFVPRTRYCPNPFAVAPTLLLGMVLGCLVLVFYHTVVQPHFASPSTTHGYRRGDLTLRSAYRMGASLLIGILSHIAWDSMTHRSGWTVRHVPLLQMELFHLPGGAVHVYFLFKHFSTLIGLGLLAIWCGMIPPLSYNRGSTHAKPYRQLAYLAVTAASALGSVAMAAATTYFGYGRVSTYARHGCGTALAVAACYYLALATVRHLSPRQSRS